MVSREDLLNFVPDQNRTIAIVAEITLAWEKKLQAQAVIDDVEGASTGRSQLRLQKVLVVAREVTDGSR